MKSLEKQFNALKSQSEEQLPLEGHQLRFERKLEQHNRPAIKLTTWLSIAASLALLMGLSIRSLPSPIKASHPLSSTYENQIKAQLHYLETTYKTDFSTPLQDIKFQLELLNTSYRELETRFNDLEQHPLLLKAMIDNLQQQLELLNELEQALKARKENDYENSIL